MKYRPVMLSLLLMLSGQALSNQSLASAKSYVAVCDKPNEALAARAVYQQSFWQPSGEKTSLYVLPSAPEATGCQVQRLPFETTAVQWAGLVPDPLASQLDGGVILEGSINRQKKFVPDNVSPLQDPPEEPQPRFHPEAGKPRPTATSQSDERVSGNPTAPRQEATVPPEKSPPQKKQMTQAAGQTTATVSKAEGDTLAPHSPRRRQDDISQAGFPKSPFVRSGWIWKPEAWQKNPQETLHILERWKMRQVYITIPVKDPGQSKSSETTASETPIPRRVAHASLLKAFLKQAHQQGVQVWAVDGDRFALLPEERKDFLERAKAYAAFNAQADPDARIDGLQFDIEPYLVPGYNLDSPTWNESYLTLLKGVKTETDLAVEVVLPFWFQQQKAGSHLFLDQLADWVDGLAIMDYRTDTQQIHHFAKPFLDWGAAYGKPVQIALESGFLPDTPTQIYRPAFSGDLYLLRKHNLNLLILLNEPIKAPLQGKSFAFSHASSSASKQVTFYRQSDQLTRTLSELQPLLTPWKSFAGVAIHGID
jgi:hypothetical protein